MEEYRTSLSCWGPFSNSLPFALSRVNMRDLFFELNKSLEENRPCVFCSLVETRGSTPQKAGAAMIIYPDGSQAGTLGGGCVEAEVKQRALRLLGADESSTPTLLTFNLDDNYGWDDGLICGGRMSILADPLNSTLVGEQEPGRKKAIFYYKHLYHLHDSGVGGTEAVVLNDEIAGLPAGQRYLFDSQGHLVAELAETPPSDNLLKHLQPVLRRPTPYTVQGVSYLPHWPRITLLIVGGGHVGQAVARLAAEVDFDIWVADDREAFASKERFPSALKFLVGDLGETLKQLVAREIKPSIFCLIVTRGHNHDEEALYHLAGCKAGYVGMIGSKRKIKLIYEDLLARGISREDLEKVHAPLGFAIGAKTVPEIAVSIVAELIACRNLGQSLPEARVKVNF